MNNAILEHQPTWRYCNVRAGEKKPYPNNWQNMPLTLDQVESTNVGLILGPKGNGILAIDFDGTSAWTWIVEQGVQNLPVTPTWTSGKTDRCQMAFSVPERLWDVLKTKKVATGEREGFEFRWAGGQSVLPPSIHPDTNKPYEWIVDATTPVAEIPEDLLHAWLRQMTVAIEREIDTTPERTINDLDQFIINEADSVLKILKSKSPVLTYDDWRTVCWGIAHHVGRDAAGILIRQYYPEQSPGEYRNLYQSWDKSKSPTLGSVMYMAGLSGGKK